LTPNRSVISDASGKLTVSSVTDTELGYLSGVTSSINANFINTSNWISSKPDNITLTPNRSVISDASGKLTVSPVTNTELGYLSGLTGSVNANFLNTSNWITTKQDIVTLTPDRSVISDASGKLTVSPVTNTELGYLSGLTGSVNANFINTSNWISSKQDILSAGDGVTIIGNVISSTGGGGTSSQWITSGNNIFYISGNVGIGSSNPNSTLDVLGNLSISGNINSITSTELGYLSGLTGSVNTNFINTSNWITTKQDIVTFTPDRSVITDVSGKLTVSPVTNTELGYLSGVTSSINANFINTSNWITTKQNTLISGSGITINGNTISSSDTRWSTVNTNDIYMTSTTNSIGFGTTTPRTDILGGYTTGTVDIYNKPLIIRSTAETLDTCIWLGTPYTQELALKCAIIAKGLGDSSRSKLMFCLENTTGEVAGTNNASVNDAKMTIMPNGNVGIGSTIPQFNLDIVGTNPILRIFDPRSDGNTILAFKESSDLFGFDMGYIGITDNKFYIRSYNNSSTPNVRLSIDRKGGFIGIGTTTANRLLHLHNNTVTSQALIQFSDLTTTTSTNRGSLIGKQNNQDLLLYNYQGNSSILFGTAAVTGTLIERMRIQGNGNVGIANTNSVINLSVGSTNANHTLGRAIITANNQHNANKRDTLQIGRWDGATGVTLSTVFTGMSCIVGAGANMGEANDNHSAVTFSTWGNGIASSREVMRINQRGNVGIGTTNPQYKLELNGYISLTNAATAAPIAIRFANTPDNRNSYIGMDAFGLGNFETGALLVGTWSANSLIFATNAAQRMRITSTGLVGIGLTDPAALLHVAAGTYSTGAQTMRYFNYATALTQSASFTVTNTCAVFDSSIWVKSIIASSSDTRIKKNIQDINDDNALQKILSIQPKTYNYIDPYRGTSNVYGFIAQQIKEVIPEAVGVHTDTVPNIFSIATCTSNSISFDSQASFPTFFNDIHINDKLDIIKNDGAREIYTVTQIIAESAAIILDRFIPGDTVFVYGKVVDDFHTLDKSYIYTLNVCATQLLSNKIDQLTNIVNTQNNQIADLIARIQALEQK
jgi:hypothetical protein